MTAESNVGARLLLIGKDAALAGLREITAATAALNKEIAAGGAAGKAAAAGTDEEAAALERLNAVQDLYKKNLVESTAATDSLAKVGKYAFFGLTAAAAAWGYESIKWAQNYQTQLVRLRTQAGLTVGAMNAIGKAAMANSAALGTSPTSYVEAAYHPASTGMSVAETIAITNNAAKLAAIGGAPLEDTTNALTGLMKSYNTPASGTARTAALLNAAVGAGNMRFSDLNSALASGVGATSKTFGVSETSFLGALAFMTDRGVPASQAGTHLRMTEALLGAPSQEANKILTAAGLSSSAAASTSNAMASMLQSAGVSTTQLSAALRNNSGGGGIYNALSLLHGALGGMSPEMQSATISRAFGGGRMGTTVEMMYNSLGSLGQKTQQIDKNGTTKKLLQDWNAETQTLDFQLKKLGGTLETLGTQFGVDLLPVLTDGIKVLGSVATFFSKNHDAALALGGVITAVLVPAMGVYLKRTLLSTGGAIQTVIGWYYKLITGQLAEDRQLVANDAALGTNDAALSANDAELAANDALRTGGTIGSILSFLGGAGGTVLGGAATLYGISALGNHAQSVFNSQNAPVIKSATALQKKIGTLQKQMNNAKAGIIGDVESWGPFGAFGKWATAEHIPGLQNNTAGIMAKDEPLLRQYQTQLTALKKLDPEAFIGNSGGGSARPLVVHNYVTVKIDGKKVTKAVTKTTKARAALS